MNSKSSTESQPTKLSNGRAVRPPSGKPVNSGLNDFTYRNLIIHGCSICLLFFLNKLGVPGSILYYLIILIMAFKSMEGAIKALALSALILTANPFLIDINEVHTYCRFPVLIAAGWRILMEVFQDRSNISRQSYFVMLLVFGLICAIGALINQYYTIISLLKITIFVYGAYIIMLAAELMNAKKKDMTVWFSAFILFFIFGNMVAYLLGVAYQVRGEVFAADARTIGMAGITNHPQTLGVLAPITMFYALSIYLFTAYRLRWIMGFAVVFLAGLCYMSAARTGLFAALLAFGVIFIMVLHFAAGKIRIRLNISRVKLFGYSVILMMGLIFIDLISGGGVREKISDFALKSVRTGSGKEFQVTKMFETRMGAFENAAQIFLKRPFTGISFGTSTSQYFIDHATMFSAPTEKGVLPAAILEETGITGTIAFWTFIILYFRRFGRTKNIVAVGIMVCFLFLNLGEMMFFALGANGLYCWIFIGAGIMLGDRVLVRAKPSGQSQRVYMSPNHSRV